MTRQPALYLRILAARWRDAASPALQRDRHAALVAVLPPGMGEVYRVVAASGAAGCRRAALIYADVGEPSMPLSLLSALGLIWWCRTRRRWFAVAPELPTQAS